MDLNPEKTSIKPWDIFRRNEEENEIVDNGENPFKVSLQNVLDQMLY